jgi:uncharacterized integral membrane protein
MRNEDELGPNRPAGDRHHAIGVGGRFIASGLALGVLCVVLAAQNGHATRVHLLLWNVKGPLYGVAVVSALVGTALAQLSAGLWRRRGRDHEPSTADGRSKTVDRGRRER